MFLICEGMYILKVYLIHYVYSLIHYIYTWDKTQMLKKFPSNRINGSKNALFSFASSNSS